MSEDFLQYIWQHGLYLPETSRTTDGDPVETIFAGQPNIHAGPDFTDARVKIGDILWAGCVEIHLRSSDWERHGHHNDPAYNNVVLHVVYEHDADAFNANRRKIPVMELHFDSRYFDNYNSLTADKAHISCRDKLHMVSELERSSWIDRLAAERLEQKSDANLKTYEITGNNWEETLYRNLARNFGFSLNALPFENLAASLPLGILSKHKDNPQQTEALLFGQAGMLADGSGDAYYMELRKEYSFLQKKYRLTPIDGFLWKFLRLRPVNFPTLRIAQFAALIGRNERLFSQIIEAENPESLENIFDVKASEYWDTHYVFGKDSPRRAKSFGQTAFRTILINTVAPFLFVYGKARDKEIFCTRALRFLENLPPERNAILGRWEEAGMSNNNAFASQALLQLTGKYCMPKKCLHCAVGNKIVRNYSPADVRN